MNDIFGLGIPFLINDELGRETTYEQFRFPRSKKKRIRNKWKKQRKNFRFVHTQKPVCFQMNLNGRTVYVMNAPFRAQLMAQVKAQDKRSNHMFDAYAYSMAATIER